MVGLLRIHDSERNRQKTATTKKKTKKEKLYFRSHLQKILKPIKDWNLFSLFQTWWWNVVIKLKLKDQGINNTNNLVKIIKQSNL